MFHKPLPQQDKELVLRLLTECDSVCRVLICTVALGMLGCPDIRSVIHYGVPRTVEAYYQESWRRERDNAPAIATLMFNGHDIQQQPHPLVDTTMRNYCVCAAPSFATSAASSLQQH